MCAIVLIAALHLGGGSRMGFAGDVVVQLSAVPMVVFGLRGWSSRMTADFRELSVDALFHLALLLLVASWVVQMIIPHQSLGLDTPGGAPIGLSSVGQSYLAASARGGAAIPAANWAAGISFIPCAAILFGASRLKADQLFKLMLVVIGIGALALLAGFIQVVQGPYSGLRLYATTNPSEAVGFFANRNHFAAQLYVTLLFSAVALAYATEVYLRAKDRYTHTILWFVLCAILVVAVMAGIMMARSRAGLVLSGVAIAAIVPIFLASKYKAGRDRGHKHQAHRRRAEGGLIGRRLILSCLILGILFACQFGIQRILTRFEADPLDDLRVVLSPATLELAKANLPFGAGFGSFVPVYAAFENPQHLFGGFANRAHNDWAELILEAGLLGLLAELLFAAWLAARTFQMWRLKPSADTGLSMMLPRAAAVAILLLLAHSFVDYPLRTTALSTVFALCCAIMIAFNSHSKHISA
jgi:O-antigen ligase